jgi:predicted secreted hydrolase
MLFLLRDALGASSPAYGTIVAPDGKTAAVGAKTVGVKPIGSWLSPHSQTTYPSGWTVDIPERDLHLTLKPVLADQELDTRRTTGQIYWEGEVSIDGRSHGSPLAGKGYVELTGYARAGAAQ